MLNNIYALYNPDHPSPAMSVLLACYRRFLGTESEAAWQALLTQPIDTAALMDVARYHGAELLVQHVLVSPYKAQLPAALVEAMTRRTRRILLQQLHLTQEAVTIHQRLSELKIAHCYLKGPPLNHTLFGMHTLRYSGDLDIFVLQHDLLAVDQMLRSLGFTTTVTQNQLARYSRVGAAFVKDITYSCPERKTVVEVHWKTHIRELLFKPIALDWSTQVITSGFYQIPVLNDYDNCLYLCLHAAKHHWKCLRWLLDIAQLIRLKNLNIDELLRRAEKQHLAPMMYRTLWLCQHWFGLHYGVLDALPKHTQLSIERGTQRCSRWIHFKRPLTGCNWPLFFAYTAYRHFFLDYCEGQMVSGRWRQITLWLEMSGCTLFEVIQSKWPAFK